MARGVRVTRAVWLTAGVAFAWTAPLQAQTPYLVTDINTVPSNSLFASGNPKDLAVVGGLVFFRADSTAYHELWKSDGTAEGTVLVKDINFGGDASPAELTNLNGTLLFSADDGINGVELWRSDGTEAGTVLVRDINPGAAPSNPTALVAMNGLLFFGADDGVNGVELWKSDGTPEGTALVRDLNPGGDSGPHDLVAMNGTLFFFATDGAPLGELWRSDGTPEGTVLVSSIGPGAAPHDLTVGFGTLFFGADDGIQGDELWKSDGTPAGTVQVADVNPNGDSHPSQLLATNDTLFFAATDGASGNELWRSDGTVAGTVRVSDVNRGPGSSDPTSLAMLNGTILFAARASSGLVGLWSSDGTAAGTSVLEDVAVPSKLKAVNGLVFFSGCGGFECVLWKSNGTPGGTLIVKDVHPGQGTNPAELTDLNGTLLFSGADVDHAQELWKSDGTADGTVLVLDVYHFTYGSQIFVPPTDVDGTAFFVAQDGVHGSELWKSDGTAAGTLLVKDIAPGSGWGDPGQLAAVNGTLFFTAYDSHGRELWKSDGTEAGTVLVKDIQPGVSNLGPYALASGNGTLFFVADDGVHGYELWKSDGTEAGTVLVKDINPLGDSNPAYGTDVNGVFFFGAADGSTGRELWKSDGTPDGTVLVKDIWPGSADSGGFYFMPNVDGTLFFTANDGVNGVQLWKSDGTDGGTVMVKAITPPTLAYGPGELTNVNGTLFFYAEDGVHGGELWKSDGTEAGTVMVRDIVPGPESGVPNGLTPVGNVVFFAAWDAHGGELWKSDGTEAGTVMVKDIKPDTYSDPSSHPFWLEAVNGTLYFNAEDGVHGRELWKSDGTPDGTLLAGDIFPGQVGSNPLYMSTIGPTLFFRADDGQSGEEPWAVAGAAANVGIFKTDGQESSVPGLTVTYTVRATNAGPHAVSGAGVDDPLPPALLNPHWTCAASAGATCTPSGTGAIHDIVSLPASGGVTYSLSGTIDPTATGALESLARVTVPHGVWDPTLANNAFTDSDSLTPQADLDLTKTDGQLHATPGSLITYTIGVSNDGPSDAPGSAVSDVFPGTLTGVAWTCFASGGAACGAPGGSGGIADQPSLPAGSAVSYVASGTLDPGATGTLANTASVSTGAGVSDLELSNNTATDVDNLTLTHLSELVHGTAGVRSLEAQPGPLETKHYFWLTQAARSSFEVVVDGVTGSVSSGDGPGLDLLAADASTVVASSAAAGAGASRSLRFENASAAPRADELVRVQSGGCGTDCGRDAQYRIRAWDTTCHASRFNNSGTQMTVLLLQNGTSSAVTGHIWLWSSSGGSLGSQPFSLGPRAVLTLNTSTMAPAASGSVTVSHDAPYGALSGKAVAVEPATGFTFDTPLEPRGLR